MTAGEIESIRKIDSKQAERELMEKEKVIVEQAIRYFHGINFFGIVQVWRLPQKNIRET